MRNDLVSLAAEIAEHHEAAVRSARDAVQHGLEAGRLLIQAKGAMPHGEWGKWLPANFPGAARTARRYMQLADKWPEIESKMAGHAIMSIDAALRAVAPAPLLAGAKQKGEATIQNVLGVDPALPGGCTWRFDKATKEVVSELPGGKGGVRSGPEGFRMFGQVNLDEWILLGECLLTVETALIQKKATDPIAFRDYFRERLPTSIAGMAELSQQLDSFKADTGWKDVAIPELDQSLVTFAPGPACVEMVEFVPAKGGDGWHLLHYQKLDQPSAHLVFDHRPIRYTPDLVRDCLRRHGFKPATRWGSRTLTQDDYWFLVGDSEPMYEWCEEEKRLRPAFAG